MVCFKTKARESEKLGYTNDEVLVNALNFGSRTGVVIRITDSHIVWSKIWRVLLFVAEEFLSFLLVGGADAETNRCGPLRRA